MSGFFVTGTDTDVGKTWVAAGLIAGFRAHGRATGAMKPVACGTIPDDRGSINEDVALLAHYSGQDRHDRALCPYSFNDPISPHIAAEHAGISIEIAEISGNYAKLDKLFELVVVEGAGGWLTPIGPTLTMADVARELGLPVVLVVGLRLGCLNHAQLTAESIHHSGLRFCGWIASHIDPKIQYPAENLCALESRLGSSPLAVLPHSVDLVATLAFTARAAEKLLAQQRNSSLAKAPLSD
jgi:dethiobiotin synthetase